MPWDRVYHGVSHGVPMGHHGVAHGIFYGVLLGHPWDRHSHGVTPGASHGVSHGTSHRARHAIVYPMVSHPMAFTMVCHGVPCLPHGVPCDIPCDTARRRTDPMGYDVVWPVEFHGAVHRINTPVVECGVPHWVSGGTHSMV